MGGLTPTLVSSRQIFHGLSVLSPTLVQGLLARSKSLNLIIHVGRPQLLLLESQPTSRHHRWVKRQVHGTHQFKTVYSLELTFAPQPPLLPFIGPQYPRLEHPSLVAAPGLMPARRVAAVVEELRERMDQLYHMTVDHVGRAWKVGAAVAQEEERNFREQYGTALELREDAFYDRGESEEEGNRTVDELTDVEKADYLARVDRILLPSGGIQLAEEAMQRCGMGHMTCWAATTADSQHPLQINDKGRTLSPHQSRLLNIRSCTTVTIPGGGESTIGTARQAAYDAFSPSTFQHASRIPSVPPPSATPPPCPPSSRELTRQTIGSSSSSRTGVHIGAPSHAWPSNSRSSASTRCRWSL